MKQYTTLNLLMIGAGAVKVFSNKHTNPSKLIQEPSNEVYDAIDDVYGAMDDLMDAVDGAYDESESPSDDECKCYANDSGNEEFCESGEVGLDECVADERCHWGPGEIEQCGAANEFWEEDDSCMLKQDMIRGVFHLADEDGDLTVTKEEMNNALDMAESEEFDQKMEYIFNQSDADGDGKVTYDELWASMNAFMEAGELNGEDAWAIESLLEWADASLGNHDNQFELYEAREGLEAIVNAIRNEATVDGLFAMLDQSGEGDLQYMELEWALPDVCSMEVFGE